MTRRSHGRPRRANRTRLDRRRMRDIVLTCPAGTVQVQAIQCVSCGGPLDPPRGASTVSCTYCGRRMWLGGSAPELAEPEGPRLASDELLGGYRRDFGEGRRYSVSQMQSRDWPAQEHGAWPVRARASSSFGGGWSANAILGQPTVYPRSGDRRGAWAPRARTSHVEWIEAEYPDGIGAVSALRVFETHVVGSVFAVTITGVDGKEELLWQRRAELLTNAGAHVLEVPLSPPRVLRRARVYLSNSGNRWAEIDTIGLVAVAPVPELIRAAFTRRRSKRGLGGWILGGVVLAALATLWTTGMCVGTQSAGRSQEVPAPELTLAGTSVESWQVSGDELAAAGILWATGERGASSAYGSSRWSALQAIGEANTYPAHGDQATAWASLGPDDGGEWIELTWSEAVVAQRIVVVETFNPGALARIDDLSGVRPVALWKGHTAQEITSRVLVFQLDEPRAISVLRLILDTRRAQGWNEIDAVGLLRSP